MNNKNLALQILALCLISQCGAESANSDTAVRTQKQLDQDFLVGQIDLDLYLQRTLRNADYATAPLGKTVAQNLQNVLIRQACAQHAVLTAEQQQAQLEPWRKQLNQLAGKNEQELLHELAREPWVKCVRAMPEAPVMRRFDPADFETALDSTSETELVKMRGGEAAVTAAQLFKETYQGASRKRAWAVALGIKSENYRRMQLLFLQHYVALILFTEQVNDQLHRVAPFPIVEKCKICNNFKIACACIPTEKLPYFEQERVPACLQQYPFFQRTVVAPSAQPAK